MKVNSGQQQPHLNKLSIHEAVKNLADAAIDFWFSLTKRERMFILTSFVIILIGPQQYTSLGGQILRVVVEQSTNKL